MNKSIIEDIDFAPNILSSPFVSTQSLHAESRQREERKSRGQRKKQGRNEVSK